LKATLITLCFILTDDLYVIDILKFVAGHGTELQPACINIVFGYQQAQQYNRNTSIGFYQSCQLDFVGFLKQARIA